MQYCAFYLICFVSLQKKLSKKRCKNCDLDLQCHWMKGTFFLCWTTREIKRFPWNKIEAWYENGRERTTKIMWERYIFTYKDSERESGVYRGFLPGWEGLMGSNFSYAKKYFVSTLDINIKNADWKSCLIIWQDIILYNAWYLYWMVTQR